MMRLKGSMSIQGGGCHVVGCASVQGGAELQRGDGGPGPGGGECATQRMPKSAKNAHILISTPKNVCLARKTTTMGRV